MIITSLPRLVAAVEALVDAEARFATTPDVLARRALRRAEGHLARTVTHQSNTTTRPHGDLT